jgi:hypothetical protein
MDKLRKVRFPRGITPGKGRFKEPIIIIRESLKMSIGGVRYFSDSLCSLGMLQMESDRFSEFTGTRVSEIKVKSDLKKE